MDFFIRLILGLGLIIAGIFTIYWRKKNPERYGKRNYWAIFWFAIGSINLLLNF